MTRPLRIEFAGAWYHVMNRGAQRRPTFLSRADRLMFLDVLAEAADGFGIEVHAYALMGNHFHLLVRTPEPNLGQAMRHLGGVYTQRFNHRHEIDGPLFRGRYKAILVDGESYLLSVSRYIHRNPLEAGLVPTARADEWTSYQAYLGLAPVPGWLQVGPTLEMLGTRTRYETFVEQGSDPLADAFYAKSRLAPIFSSEKFRQQTQEQFRADKADPSLERARPDEATILERVEAAIAAAMHLASADPNQPSAAHHRLAAALLAREFGVTTTAIARRYGYSNGSTASAAMSRFRRTAEKSEHLRLLLMRARQSVAQQAPNSSAA